MPEQPPMTSAMNAVAAPVPPRTGPAELLLRHCLSLGGVSRDRRPPRARLEEAVGPELARRLLSSITISSRR